MSNLVLQYSNMETSMQNIITIHLSKKSKRTIFSGIVFILAIAFWYAAINKIWSAERLNEFKTSLRQFPLIGIYAGILVYLLPLVEILIGFAIVYRPIQKMGLLAYLIIIIIFTLYIIYLEISGAHLPCPCGGLSKYLTWEQHIGINILLIYVSFKILKIANLKLFYEKVNK